MKVTLSDDVEFSWKTAKYPCIGQSGEGIVLFSEEGQGTVLVSSESRSSRLSWWGLGRCSGGLEHERLQTDARLDHTVERGLSSEALRYRL
jgi:hypothetical protein